MQKFRFLLIALALCLILPSCATVEDLPPDMVITPPDKEVSLADTNNEEPQGNYRDILHTSLLSEGAFWNNWVFTRQGKIINLETGETFSVCSDPLCTNHKDVSCIQSIVRGADAIMVSHTSTQDDPVLYIGYRELVSIVDGNTPIHNYKLLRFHFYTGEVTVLAENLPGPTMLFSMDPLTDNIFLEQYTLDDDGKEEVTLYIINGRTGKTGILPTDDTGFFVKYAIGDTVYGSGYDGSYCIDLSKKELVIQETPMETSGIYGGYKYYAEEVGVERVYVPDEVIPLCEQRDVESYKDFTKYNLYRVSILQKDAVPELVADAISVSGHSANGKYLYYYDFAPQHAASYYSYSWKNEIGVKQFEFYKLDAPNIPEGALMKNIFSRYYGQIHILDIVTLQEVAVIDSEEYWIEPHDLEVKGDGAFVTWQSRAPESYMSLGGSPRIRGSGYLYFNKPYLTFEDTVEFDLSESDY